MSITKRRQLKFKQELKRKKRRALLKAKGLNADDFYYGKFYLGTKNK